jgi:hypothetical protein
MGRLRARLARLQKAARGKLDSFEIEGGSRYHFDSSQAHITLFDYWSESLRAVADGEERPEPPEILKAVAAASDRRRALEATYPQGITPWCPLDVEALVQRGELVPRPLVAGRHADEPIEDLSE